MVDSILFPNPIQVKTAEAIHRPKAATTGDIKTPFASYLDAKLPVKGVRFSQHAQDRLQSRGIKLSENDMQKLETAMNNVAVKGGRDSLIMLGDSAFVVSVKNRTVVTALDRDAMQGNVFTNIDSAVIVK
jgi:flagellar operon protein